MANCKVCGKKLGFIEGFSAFNHECDECEKKRIQESIRAVEPQNGQPQWIYPSILLDTPQSAFDFPEYPGLSVAMRLYIAVGKIFWWLGLLIIAGFNLIWAFAVSPVPGASLILTLPVSFLILVLMNLGLAFQFASSEIVKVLVRNEENTRTVKKLLEKQMQEEQTNES